MDRDRCSVPIPDTQVDVANASQVSQASQKSKVPQLEEAPEKALCSSIWAQRSIAILILFRQPFPSAPVLPPAEVTVAQGDILVQCPVSLASWPPSRVFQVCHQLGSWHSEVPGDQEMYKLEMPWRAHLSWLFASAVVERKALDSVVSLSFALNRGR